MGMVLLDVVVVVPVLVLCIYMTLGVSALPPVVFWLRFAPSLAIKPARLPVSQPNANSTGTSKTAPVLLAVSYTHLTLPTKA